MVEMAELIRIKNLKELLEIKPGILLEEFYLDLIMNNRYQLNAFSVEKILLTPISNLQVFLNFLVEDLDTLILVLLFLIEAFLR